MARWPVTMPDAADVTYTPADLTDWTGSADPGDTNDAIDQLADRTNTLEAGNALLDGSLHTDTAAQAVTRGSLIYGDATPEWNELVVGGANTLLGSDGTDVAWRAQSFIDHGSIGGLPDDDHSQYALLAGRTGTTNDLTLSTDADGTLTGSDASGGDLILESTSHATAGQINARDTIRLLEAFADVSSGAPTNRGLRYEEDVTVTSGSTGAVFHGYSFGGTLTDNSQLAGFNASSLIAVHSNAVYQCNDDQFGGITLFQGGLTVQNESATSGTPGAFRVFDSLATLRSIDNDIGTVANFDGFRDNSTAAAITNADSALIITNYTSFLSSPALSTDIAGASITATNRRGLWIEDIAKSGAGTETCTNNYGIEIESLSGGSTLNIGIAFGTMTHMFEFPADATDPTGGGGAATGRIPVRIGGATVYLAYY